MPELSANGFEHDMKLHSHLQELIRVVVWMSGAQDFSPEGPAHEGWKKARTILAAAMDYDKALCEAFNCRTVN